MILFINLYPERILISKTIILILILTNDQALRKVLPVDRPASAPAGNQRKRTLQNIVKSKVASHHAPGTKLIMIVKSIWKMIIKIAGIVGNEGKQVIMEQKNTSRPKIYASKLKISNDNSGQWWWSLIMYKGKWSSYRFLVSSPKPRNRIGRLAAASTFYRWYQTNPP